MIDPSWIRFGLTCTSLQLKHEKKIGWQIARLYKPRFPMDGSPIREAVSMMRRVTILFAGLLALSVIVAIAVPRPEQADDPTPRTVATTPKGNDVTATVQGTLPRDKVVRAKVGEIVELSVTSSEPNSVSLEAFGLTEAADRGAPARFSFLADRPGSFDVILLLGEKTTVGRVLIR
jgi:hypothetical protein